MKLPRWLVIGMLTSSVLAVLAAAGWWWVTWPERTARNFVELLVAGRTEEAERMMGKLTDDRSPRTLGSGVVTLPESWAIVEPEHQSLVDVLSGKRQYRMTKGFGGNLTVERGTVTEPVPPVIWVESIHGVEAPLVRPAFRR